MGSANAAVIKVLDNVIPMYVAMIFGWLTHHFGIITATGYDGLQQFLVVFCLPFMIFTALITSNLYQADGLVVACIAIQGIISLVIAVIFAIIFRKFTEPSYRANPHFSTVIQLRWDVVTAVFCILTFPNSLVVGVPILVGMYGEQADFLQVFIVVIQVVFIVPTVVTLFVITDAFRTRVIGNMLDSPKATVDQECIYDDQNPSDLERQRNSAAPDIVPAPTDISMHSHSPVNQCKFASNMPDLDPEPCRKASKHSVASTKPSVDHGFNEKNQMVCETVNPLELEETATEGGNETLLLIKKIFLNPLIIGSIAGVIFSLIAYGVKPDFKVPLMFLNIVQQFSNCVGAVALFQIGYFMYDSPIFPEKGQRIPLLVSLLCRFIVSPVMMGALAFGLGLRKLEWDVITLQAALPQAIVTFTLGTYYNIMGPLFGMSIVYGTILSLPVALIYYQLFQLVPAFYMSPVVA